MPKTQLPLWPLLKSKLGYVMKKFIASLAAVAALTSVSVFATEITSGTPIQAGNQGCDLLAEAVTINLSTNVNGAYACNSANNTIRVATCHSGGSRKSGTIACAVVNVIPGVGGGLPVNEYNDPECDGTPDQTFDSSSSGKGFQASTAGGSVAATSLGSACTSASVVDDLLQ